MVTIDGKFPSFNDYISAMNRSRWTGRDMKAEQTTRVCNAAIAQGEPHRDGPVWVYIRWVEPNARRDIDNIRFAAKFILDGLVEAEVIDDDSQHYVRGITDQIEIDRKHPRVEVTLMAMEA